MWTQFWARKSIRFWVAASLALVVLPLGVSSVLGYALLKHGVLDSFKDIAARQNDQIGVARQLQLALWEAAIPVDQYVDDAKPSEKAAYRALRQTIEARFARLHETLIAEPELLALLERARVDWSTADGVATDVLSVRRDPGDALGTQLADRFGDLIASINDKLSAVTRELSDALSRDYADAQRAYERAEWIAGIAAGISVLFILASIWMIGRILITSIERLVDGASRFGSGDRDFRVEISIPPELHKVADEFNRMIVQIHEAELGLAELARHDKLTGALNRRAFDEALAEAFSRQQRAAERFALLIIDVDHFKRINDTYGHVAGDQVLRSLVQTLRTSLRDIDKVFRIGGEEFAVLLPGTEARAAEIAAERLRGRVADEPVVLEMADIHLTISLGIALPTETSTVETLMKGADAALYQAKASGRNRFVLGEAA